MPRLSHKTALVTGAARGIGRAIAETFAADGARVWLSDLDAVALVDTARETGLDALALDVRDEADWETAITRVFDECGALHVLVNNAGITGLEAGAAHDPEHVSLEEWRRVHATNLDGSFLGCKHALRAMRRLPQGETGSIINLSSRSGVVGIPAAAAYASSKAAIRNHTKSVALYCAEQGLPVRCNSVHPAAILTPMWEPILGTGAEREATMRAMVADTPLKRFGTPKEVADLAVFLASDESSYITGAEFHVDGGILAGAAGAPAVDSSV
jgi:NAD(P)-dependent dehydrogenase (short-subunit alcohol dehydrogenase family)